MYVCAVVVEYIETGDGETEKLTALESSKVSQENVRTIFSGLHAILSSALKQPSLKTEVRRVVHIQCISQYSILISLCCIIVPDVWMYATIITIE